MKMHMAKTWTDMSGANTNIILASICKPTCITLCDSLEAEGVKASDPEADIPTGLEVARGLPQKQNEKVVSEHCITLFNHLSEATGHISPAMVNLSSLAKITDHETFKMILQASAQPLVQLNIPVNMLNSIMDKKNPKWQRKHTRQKYGKNHP